jgi:hypothetical protein
MRSWFLVTAALLLVIGGPASAQNRKCLHGSDETSSDRARREKAVELAFQINAAEGMTRRLGRAYAPLDQLFNVSKAPDGFRVQLHTDGTTYTLSIKDTIDPCLYAVFSDQGGDVYEATPVPDKGRVHLLPLK